MKPFVMILFCIFPFLLPSLAVAQDFGLDFNAKVTKKIVKGFNIAASVEVRTQDKSTALERIDAGIDLSYKPIDYLKFGVGYNFIDAYKLSRETEDGETIDHYWSPRHRVNVSVTGIFPIDQFEISLRERYQYTHRMQRSVPRWNSLGVAQDNKIVSAKDDHVLRSRVLAKYNIKSILLSPYFSMELHNDLADSFSLDKVRLIVGTEYAVHKHHTLELFYRYTAGIANADDECHLLGLGYAFKF